MIIRRLAQSAVITFVRPYSARELPGWGKVYDIFVGGHRDWLWKDAPIRVAKSKINHFKIKFDLLKWPDRLSYFLGRWYSLEIQLATADLVKPGDTVIDIGANRGMFSLTASHIVGARGKVISFEPNPECIRIFEEDIRENGIQNICLEKYGLSDQDDILTLTVPSDSGGATFGDALDEAGIPGIKLSLPVKIGDSILASETPSLFKMDVEGFELKALAGLTETVSRCKPTILMEINDTLLAGAGSSTPDLFRFMHDRGYIGRRLGIAKSEGAWTWTMSDIDASKIDGKIEIDAIWLHRDRAGDEKLASHMR